MAKQQLGVAPANSNDAATVTTVNARTPKVTASTTAPASPSLGDVWIDLN